jgi:5-methylcytosine-specific restriction endonuclease McrA
MPASGWFDDFTKIRSSKGKPRYEILRRIAPSIQARYCLYFQHLPALEALAKKRKWPNKVKEALQHCYSGSTQAWDDIRIAHQNAIRSDPPLCPYCLIRDPASFDHFLPKAEFPEFSVLTVNLVRVCYSCNLRKGDNLVGANRQVLNPYYDPIPRNDPILFADVNVTGEGKLSVRFYIATDLDDLSNEFINLAERHLKAFQLDEAYALLASNFIDGVVNEIAVVHGVPIDAPALQRIIEGRRGQFAAWPVNSWELALIDGLEDCAGFLNWLNDRVAATPKPAGPERRRPRGPLRLAVLAAAEAAAALLEADNNEA